MATDPSPDNLRSRMEQNAADQAAALGQDPGGADRDKLIAGRMREPVTSGLEGERTAHPEAAWFGRSPVGLFVHWGIPSVHGDCDLSWSMIANLGHDKKITPEDYWAQADRFHPEHFDPGTWLSAARKAGFEYAVLTTKHHDGYTLFPTETTEMGVRTHLGGRDLVREFVDACRANGLRPGLYFSGVDWWLDRNYRSFNYRSETGISPSSLPPIPGRPAFDIRHQVCTPPPMPEAEIEKNKALCRQQLVELLTNYGKIDILWFDGGCGSDISVEEIRRLQPGIVINNRGNCRWEMTGGTFPGDFYTVEFGDAPARPPGWWEQLRIWNEPCWGYTLANETRYAATPGILELLARTKAWGGACLLNSGPRPDGSMPAPYFRGMEEITSWMAIYGESLRDVAPVPAGVETNVPVTTKSDRWFLHLTARGPIEISPGRHASGIASLTRLRDGSPVAFDWDGARLLIPAPSIVEGIGHDVLELRVTI